MIESNLLQKETSLPPLGVLIGDGNLLKYYPFGKLERYPDKIAELKFLISSLLVTPEEIYCGLENGDIFGLFDSLRAIRDGIVKMNGSVNSLIEYNGQILDSGSYGVCNTLDDKVLISKAAMDGRSIISFHSLFTADGELYGLAKLEDLTYALLHFDESDGKLVIGDTLLRYGFNVFSAQAIPVPGELKSKNGKTYPFSVLSSANGYYLDINGEEVERTEREETPIYRIALLSSTPEKVTVVYPDCDLKIIMQAEIDLEERTAETSVLVDGLSPSVYAIAPVFDKELHERLLDNEGR